MLLIYGPLFYSPKEKELLIIFMVTLTERFFLLCHLALSFCLVEA